MPYDLPSPMRYRLLLYAASILKTPISAIYAHCLSGNTGAGRNSARNHALWFRVRSTCVPSWDDAVFGLTHLAEDFKHSIFYYYLLLNSILCNLLFLVLP